MKICLYGSAKDAIDEVYKTRTAALVTLLAGRGHQLVFGGGDRGLMGVAARAMKNGGGRVTGVAPDFFKEGPVKHLYDGSDALVSCKTMYERKQIMEELADGFLIVPGGIGTYDEFFGVMSTKQLGRHDKPIAVFNVNGFYDDLDAMIKSTLKKGFIGEEYFNMCKFSDRDEEILRYFEDSTK